MRATAASFTKDEISYLTRAFYAVGVKAPLKVDTFEVENDAIVLDGEGLYIQKGEEEVALLGGSCPGRFRLMPYYVLSMEVVTPGNRWQPDDVDVSEYSKVGTIGEAVRDTALRIAARDIDNALDNLSYSLQAEELNEEQV